VPWLIVNGRCISRQVIQQAAGLSVGQMLRDEAGELIAACVRYRQGASWGDPPQPQKTAVVADRALIERPWHIMDQVDATLLADILSLDLPAWDDRTANVVAFGEYPLKVHPAARVKPGAILSTESGPIAIDDGAVVGPGTLIEGPCYIGPASEVAPGARMRSSTSLGPVCRVGGEVSHAIFQSYSNKVHDGYLGHALVGQWVNLGAATNVSNLKNTYGNVRVQVDLHAPREDTGRTFFGPILGDFVRTAIGTRIPTGAVIGTGCMVALSTFAPTFAPRFGFYTDLAYQPYELDKFLQTARTMMARRKQEMTPAQEYRLLQLARGGVRQG
jgi:UDP-N-acetylglucosamine diphosphorylase/glucosamine-1-phosphate N-acetyltransferase